MEEVQDPPTESPSETIIVRAARRFENDPRVVASALAAYRTRTRVSDVELASWLELPVTGLHRLALCTKPKPEDAHYADDVLTLARHVGCNADRLRSILDEERQGGPR